MSDSTMTGMDPERSTTDALQEAGPSMTAPQQPPEATSTPPAPPAAQIVADDAAAAARRQKRRRLLRAVGRWTAAVVVFGALGSGVTYGLTEQERTDLPGLATKDDGRWEYPELVLPALPSGSPRPFGSGNDAEIHHADVRDLLLPVPEGAIEGEDLPSIDGTWVSLDTFAKVYSGDAPADIEQELTNHAVRHIAARGWVMPDGTRTSVYLLQFNSGAYPGGFFEDAVLGGVTPLVALAGAQEEEIDESWPEDSSVPNVDRYAFDEAKPRGGTHVRQAYLIAGDTLAVIVQSRKGTAEAVPFQQTVILQSQLLG